MQHDQVIEKINQLIAAEEWEAALAVERQLIDEHHEGHDTCMILEHVKPDVEKLRSDNSGCSWCLLGIMYWHGKGGVEKDEKEAYRCFSRGADLHHVYSLYKKGLVLWYGWGVHVDEDAGYTCFVAAAEGGCREAFGFAGQAYKDGRGVEQDYFKAAVWYIKGGCQFHLESLLCYHRDECVPWGCWTSDPLIQQLVLPVTRDAMYTALLVCKRVRLPRYVDLLIVSYICTKE